MMKRNLDQHILDLDGKEFQPPLSLQAVCMNATLGMAVDGSDNNMPMERKLALYKLGKKMHEGGVQDFSAEEITLLKERVAKSFNTLVMGQTFELLEKDWTAAVLDMPKALPPAALNEVGAA